MRPNQLRSSVSFWPRFGTLIILNRSIQVKVWTIRGDFLQNQKEHQSNGFLAGDHGADRCIRPLHIPSPNLLCKPYTLTCIQCSQESYMLKFHIVFYAGGWCWVQCYFVVVYCTMLLGACTIFFEGVCCAVSLFLTLNGSVGTLQFLWCWDGDTITVCLCSGWVRTTTVTVYHCFMQRALQEGVGHLEGFAAGASKHNLASPDVYHFSGQRHPESRFLCFPLVYFWIWSSGATLRLWDKGVGVRPNANGFIKSDPADDASQFTSKLPQTKYFGSLLVTGLLEYPGLAF